MPVDLQVHISFNFVFVVFTIHRIDCNNLTVLFPIYKLIFNSLGSRKRFFKQKLTVFLVITFPHHLLSLVQTSVSSTTKGHIRISLLHTSFISIDILTSKQHGCFSKWAAFPHCLRSYTCSKHKLIHTSCVFMLFPVLLEKLISKKRPRHQSAIPKLRYRIGAKILHNNLHQMLVTNCP